MKIKTAEATELQLDWLVATIEGYTATIKPSEIVYTHPNGAWHHNGNWRPTANWSQGGPIIEREKMNINSSAKIGPNQWVAIPRDQPAGRPSIWYGPTPLIAAMRCFVASKLGDEVEVPDELR